MVVAIHANHPRELTAEARAACPPPDGARLLLVSQTVLLKGVNDDVEVLDALMRAFVEARIKPYYLHHGDLAPGAAHWRTSIAEGQALMRAYGRGSAASPCRPTCSTFPAATARSRSRTARFAPTARAAIGSPTPPASSGRIATASPERAPRYERARWSDPAAPCVAPTRWASSIA